MESSKEIEKIVAFYAIGGCNLRKVVTVAYNQGYLDGLKKTVECLDAILMSEKLPSV